MGIFKTLKGSYPNSPRSDLAEFQTHTSFTVVLVTCKNEKDPIKNEGARKVTTFLQLHVYGDFSRRSRAANSEVLCLILPNFEPILDFMVVLVTCKNKEEPSQNEEARVGTSSLWELSVAMETRVLIPSSPKPILMQSITHPNNDPD